MGVLKIPHLEREKNFGVLTDSLYQFLAWQRLCPSPFLGSTLQGSCAPPTAGVGLGPESRPLYFGASCPCLENSSLLVPDNSISAFSLENSESFFLPLKNPHQDKKEKSLHFAAAAKAATQSKRVLIKLGYIYIFPFSVENNAKA